MKVSEWLLLASPGDVACIGGGIFYTKIIGTAVFREAGNKFGAYTYTGVDILLTDWIISEVKPQLPPLIVPAEDKLMEQLLEMAEQYHTAPAMVEVPKPLGNRKCTCEFIDVLQVGCKCGGI